MRNLLGVIYITQHITNSKQIYEMRCVGVFDDGILIFKLTDSLEPSNLRYDLVEAFMYTTNYHSYIALDSETYATE